MAALSLVAVGGVFAVNFLKGSNLDAAQYIPADAVAYVEFTADPGAAQKVEAAQLLNRLSEGLDALDYTVDEDPATAQRDAGQAVLDLFCSSTDYEDDIEPWLGSTIAAAVTPEDGGTPILVVRTTDAEASEDGLRDLYDCAYDYYDEWGEELEYSLPDLADQFDDDLGVAYDGEWAVVAANQNAADDALEAAKEQSLADDEHFSKTIAELGELGIATGWLSGERLTELGDDYMTSDTRDGLQEVFASQAVTFRVDGDVAEVSGVVLGEEIVGVEQGDFDPTTLPGDSVYAAYWGNLGDSAGAHVADDYSDGFGYSDSMDLYGGEFISWLFGPVEGDPFDIGYVGDVDDWDDDDFFAVAASTPESPYSGFPDEPESDADCVIEDTGRLVIASGESVFSDGGAYLDAELYEEEYESDIDWYALEESYWWDEYLDDDYYYDFEEFIYAMEDEGRIDLDDWTDSESYAYCETTSVEAQDMDGFSVWTDDESWAEQAADQSGDLGSQDSFTQVIPDAGKSDLFMFVNNDMIADNGEDLADVIESAGYSVDQQQGKLVVTARVLFR
ncbi:MAG: DUF3352 domain-containing protein [Aeromicrobium sp.]|uniref:DUF3352 domain-containing protein n=1 Tax=Aeromicrobium sp. TaxID=1871063 RepID=UPI0039E4A6FB